MSDFPELNRFAEDLRARILDAVRKARETQRSPVAAFDADGTLWSTDVSDDLLDFVDARGLIPPPEGSATVRAHYDTLCATTSRGAAYSFAAAVFGGLPVAEVQAWADASFAERGANQINPEMAALVRFLTAAGVEVFIVSASPVWAVLPGAHAIGVPADHVIAIDVDRWIGDGIPRLTGEVERPITSGPGKVARLQARTLVVPFLAAGNTVDDLPLLESASDLRLVIDPRPPHGSSEDLAEIARDRGMEVHHTSGNPT